MRAVLLSLLLLLPLLGTSAGVSRAHGLWGHIHVTGWGVEALPPGEVADFFADPEVMNAALFGATYTDSGYYPQSDDDFAHAAHAYGEASHWEAFVQAYVAWMVANDPPPWSSLESKKRAAFIMGCAAHGLQDELFDSLFLYQVAEHDDGDQEAADPATDGFLALDGRLRFFPTEYLPLDVLVPLFADMTPPVTGDTIQRAVDMVTSLYITAEFGPVIAQAQGEKYADELPWTRSHYMDPSVPGSLASEVPATTAYLLALWDRLHGRPAPLVTYAFPAAPARLRSATATTTDSWVTIVFGIGAVPGSAQASVVDAHGAAVAFTRADTRWPATMSRILRLMPDADLAPGAWYDVTLASGTALVDGTTSSETFALHFQVACASPDDPACDDSVAEADASVELSPEATVEPSPEVAAEAEAEAEPAAPASDDGCHAAPVDLLTCLSALALVSRVARRRRS